MTDGALYFHHKQLWYLACKARDRCLGVELPTLADDALVAIILAASSAEAFINGIAVLARSGSPYLGYQPSPPVAALARALADDKDALQEKYSKAGRALGEELNGTSPHQDLVQLIRLRNGMLHNKPATDAAMTKTVQDLAQRRLARSPATFTHESGQTRSVTESWVDLISTEEVADWACETSRSMQRVICDLLPAGYEFDRMKSFLRL